MKVRRHFLNILVLLALLAGALAPSGVALANSTAQPVPFSQNWTNTGLITTANDWSGVLGIQGFQGADPSTTTAGIDPRTILTPDTSGTPQVFANQTLPNTFSSGGVAEFEITNPVVALAGSGTADAPYISLYLDTTGKSNLQMNYILRDIDSSADNTNQQVALQYRLGSTGNFTNIPEGYVADASAGPSLTLDTPMSVMLPAAVNNQPLVEIRIMTTNASGNDEWIGIDDILVQEVAPQEPAPEVVQTTPAANATNVDYTSNVVVAFSEPVNVTGNWFELDCNVSGVRTPANTEVTGGPTTFTINPNADFQSGDVCNARIVKDLVTDQDTEDPADAMAEDYTWTFRARVEAADLVVTKSGPAVAAIDADVTYTLSVQNTGSLDATNVILTDTLPAGMVYVSDSQGGATNPEPGVYVWSLGSLASGASASLTLVTHINASVTAGSVLVNRVAASTATTDANLANNAAQHQLTARLVTKIHAIQGSGSATPMLNATVTFEGIVVGDFQGTAKMSGFYVQEEDADADTNPATSEGIFVYDQTFGVDVNVGDKVLVTGQVTEYKAQTEFTYTLTEIKNVSQVVVSTSTATVTPAVIDLNALTITEMEAFEGMSVQINSPLYVTDNYTLSRYGDVALSTVGPEYQYTQIFTPTTSTAYNNYLDTVAERVILLDDGSSRQNPDPATVPAPGLSATNTLRIGDSLPDGVSGVLDQFNVFRIQPTAPVTFTHSNPRAATPEDVGGRLKVVSFNTLNYFTTLDTGAAICGPTGGQDCRGANSALEFQRQQAKLVAAICGAGADVVGLMEIENPNPNNDPLPADGIADYPLQALTQAVNAACDLEYTFSDDTFAGTDAIRVAILYRDFTVSPVGTAILDTQDFVNPFGATTDKNRPALAQTFEEISTGEKFTFVVNHLKSKGSACGTVDPDTGDGQANCNRTRLTALEVLLDWLADDPTGSGDPDYMIAGDLNSYAMEDPIRFLAENDWTDLARLYEGDDVYSYLYKAFVGTLDYAMANPSLAGQVTGATDWDINGSEPVALDYNTEFKSPAQVNLFYAPTPFKSSDHSPVIVGLNLGDSEPVVAGFTSNSPVVLGDPINFTNTSTGPGTLTYEWNFGDGSAISTATNPSHTYAAAGNYTVVLTATNGTDSDTFTGSVTVNPVVEPVVAGFTSNSPVVLGNPINFTNTSTGPGTLTYEWNFGDGSAISTATNPSHTYAAAGSFTVVLTATSGTDSDTFTGSVTVTPVVEPVVAGFTSNSPVVFGNPVNFTNTSTGPGTLTYEWSFGDGSAVSTATNPSHTYTAAGSYTVVLTATNGTGSDTFTGSVTVTPAAEPVVAAFTSSSPVMVGETVIFTNTSTGPGELSYEWDFGDDSAISTTENPTHTYAAAGSFTVVLTATNGTDSDVVTGTVTVISPAALTIEKTVEAPAEAALGEVVTYTITIENTGAESAAGVVLTDTLPAGVTFGAWVNQNGATYAGGVVSWNGSLPQGTHTLVFTVTVNEDETLYGQTITNTAAFVSANAGSGSDSVAFQVTDAPEETDFPVYLPLIMRPATQP